MKDKTNLIALILVIVTAIVLIVTYITKNKNNDTDEEKVSIVTNYSDFYTVDSCLNRFIIFLSSNNKSDVFSILNEEYKEKNDITEDNVLDLFESIKEGSSFVSKKMYYTSIDKNVYKYYVYGSIEYSELYIDNSSNTNSTDTYFIVYIDKNKHLYSVEPYYGNIFTNGEIYE